MRARRQMRPQLEPLESMALLSGVAAVATPPATITLTGTARGIFDAHPGLRAPARNTTSTPSGESARSGSPS